MRMVGGTGIIGQDMVCGFSNGKYTQFEGTEIVAENCVKARVKDLVVEGKTMQDTEDLSNIESVAEREGNVLSVVNKGKNLINTIIKNKSWDKTTSNLKFNLGAFCTEKIKVKKNTTYVYSLNGSINNIGILCFNSEKKYVSDKYDSMITVTDDIEYLALQGRDPDIGKDGEMFEEGTVVTSYEPYREPIITNINMPIPLRSLPNGTCDTIEGNKLVQRVGKIVLDGNTEFNFPTSLKMTNTVLIGLTISSITKVYDSTISAISDKLQFKNIYNLDETAFFIDKTGTKLWLRLSISIYGSAFGDVKTNLALNPITIYYPLATPIIHNITVPQLRTIRGTNEVTCDNNIKPKLKLKVKVKK